MDLFSGFRRAAEPLAYRMTPRTLDEVVGQQHLTGSGKPLRVLIERDRLQSAVFYGPAGCGKTAIARIIAGRTASTFTRLNAVTDGVADVRRIVKQAAGELSSSGQRTILFIDEIHRFNRAQQDALLPSVEDGTIIFIGATTENPMFAVNTPLLSRMRIFQFEQLSTDDIEQLVQRAVSDPERGPGTGYSIEPAAVRHIARMAGGDGRVALNILELAADLTEGLITDADVANCVKHQMFRYDRSSDAHYDHASALIKSMRGSDPQAASYYVIRMLEGGEDPMFVARRIVICAAEDVGLADPQALQVAVAAAQATHMIGMPEARLLLAEAAIYIATAPKSNAVYRAVEAAASDVRSEPNSGVPLHLRDGGRHGERLGYGVGYQYPHDYPGAYVRQQYLPAELADRTYYTPGRQGYEREIERRLKQLADDKDPN